MSAPADVLAARAWNQGYREAQSGMPVSNAGLGERPELADAHFDGYAAGAAEREARHV